MWRNHVSFFLRVHARGPWEDAISLIYNDHGSPRHSIFVLAAIWLSVISVLWSEEGNCLCLLHSTYLTTASWTAAETNTGYSLFKKKKKIVLQKKLGYWLWSVIDLAFVAIWGNKPMDRRSRSLCVSLSF